MAEADKAFFDTPSVGCDDFCAFEVAGGVGELGLGRFDVGLGFLELGFAEDELGGRFGVTEVVPVEQGLFGAGFFLGEAGFGAGQAGFSSRNGSEEIRGVKFDEDVVFFEKGTALEDGRDLNDAPADPGGE